MGSEYSILIMVLQRSHLLAITDKIS